MRELIDRLDRQKRLELEEWTALLSGYDAETADYAARRARALSLERFGKRVYFRGIVEFTNICRNDCLYCGLRRSNTHAVRYLSLIHISAGDRIGIFGATPLNAAGGDNLPALMRERYGDRAVLFSEAEGPACLARMEGIKEILCLSPSCVPVCRMIRDRLGIPYQMDYPASSTLVQACLLYTSRCV